LHKEQRDERGRMKSFKEGELVLWMPKATKIKGGKFTLPWKGLFKIQIFFDNNIMELSTISDEGVERININKLKAYHHENPPTDVIVVVIVDIRLNGKIRNTHRKKNKPNFPPNLYTKPKNLPWIDRKPRGTFTENNIEWVEEENSRSGIPRMCKNERSRKFNYKGGKKTIVPLYLKNYVNKEGSHKNRKVSL